MQKCSADVPAGCREGDLPSHWSFYQGRQRLAAKLAARQPAKTPALRFHAMLRSTFAFQGGLC